MRTVLKKVRGLELEEVEVEEYEARGGGLWE